ncbi:hypothetical protein AAFG07_34575 [Bradyrhizobium sp. B097]|uniref:hypothetical protein n=1 Tax=Bradyrhizobium sp. B097 TaxID=3140244 RepID=UPI0031834350
MRRQSLVVAGVVLLLQGTTSARAEFIGNAYGGQAEETTRSAAAHAFTGHESFYAGMAQLEKRSTGEAKQLFAKSVSEFRASREEYSRAAPILRGKPFDMSRLQAPEQQLLLQFLGPFKATPASDQSDMLQAFADSFGQTAAIVENASVEMTLAKFRQVQAEINQQIVVGTLISRGLGR